MPMLYFTPARAYAEDRVVFLDFSYHCKLPKETHTTRFTLLIRGTGGRDTAPLSVGNEAAATGVPVPASADARPVTIGQFDVSLRLAPEETVQAHPFTATVDIMNRGAVAASPGQINFNWRDSVSFYPGSRTQGSVSDWIWRTARFYIPGEIAPGQTATLVLQGTANYIGPAYLVASLTGGSERADFTVVPEPRPDFAGTWEGAQARRSGFGIHRRYAIAGRLRVSNDGVLDAPASRVMLLLSDDLVPGPEDRLLGLPEVPAIPAGGAAELDVARELRDIPWNRSKYLLAVLDLGNRALEGNEANNRVVSVPLDPVLTP
jgi:hypothetical protein